MENFTYYLKRWIIAIVLIVLVLFFPGRKYLRQHGYFIFSGKEREKAILWARRDSARIADSLRSIDTTAIIAKKADPVPAKPKNKYYEEENNSNARYFVIAGSFTSPDNAGVMAGDYLKKGFESSIISITARDGQKLKLVSVGQFSNSNEAQKFLEGFKRDYNDKAWEYSKK